jgi:hypothetical protein
MKRISNAYRSDYFYPVHLIIVTRHGDVCSSGYKDRASALKATRERRDTRNAGTCNAGNDCALIIATSFVSALYHRAHGMTDKTIRRGVSEYLLACYP